MVLATASFFVPGEGLRGYVMYGDGFHSDFLDTQEAALEEIGRAFFIGELTQKEYIELERAIRASSLPSDGTDQIICEPG